MPLRPSSAPPRLPSPPRLARLTTTTTTTTTTLLLRLLLALTTTGLLLLGDSSSSLTVAAAAADNSNNSVDACIGYFDLPCYGAREGIVFEAAGTNKRTNDSPAPTSCLLSFLLLPALPAVPALPAPASAGLVVLVMVVRQVQRNPRSYFPGADRRPLLRPAAIEATIAFATAMMVSSALAMVYLRQHDIVLFQ
ncbi:hypothetical protein DFJ73DRAFT_759221 [Zopfochytrium polystomum]|nr:hypothetical protein DFJ73DRAFT_759221 [Zopfochytrium polystomum]